MKVSATIDFKSTDSILTCYPSINNDPRKEQGEREERDYPANETILGDAFKILMTYYKMDF